MLNASAFFCFLTLFKKLGTYFLLRKGGNAARPMGLRRQYCLIGRGRRPRRPVQSEAGQRSLATWVCVIRNVIALPFFFGSSRAPTPTKLTEPVMKSFCGFKRGFFQKGRHAAGRHGRVKAVRFTKLLLFLQTQCMKFLPRFFQKGRHAAGRHGRVNAVRFTKLLLFLQTQCMKFFVPLFSKSGRGSVAKPSTVCAVGVKRASVFFSAPSCVNPQNLLRAFRGTPIQSTGLLFTPSLTLRYPVRRGQVVTLVKKALPTGELPR